MKLGSHLAAVIALFLAAQAEPAMIGRDAPHRAGTLPPKDLSESVVRRSVVFEPNVGQFEPDVRYRATAAGTSVSLTDTAAMLSLGTAPASTRQVRITPLGASRHARPRALDRLAGIVNHFESAAPSGWHAGVPTYGRVRYPAVYPGIDLVYHGSPEQLEYDFVVDRGADPSRIAVRFDGADRVDVDPVGDLLIHVGEAVVRQRAPYAWQQHGHERRRVDVRYRLTTDGDVAFAIGAYDRRLPLVIDPILLYSSYLHAQSSRVALDGAGALVVVTEAFLDASRTARGIKVEKLTPDGQTAIYTTLIGSDYFPVAGVAAAPDAGVVVVGWTSSGNLPLVNASQGYPGATSSGNAFVIRLDPSGGFVFSTYLGGTNFDVAYSVSISSSGTIVVGGSTDSQDFPGIDGLRSASPEGFVTVFSANGSRVHGALLSSNIYVVKVDAAGTVYVAGDTYRRDWPTTPGAFQTDPYVATCGDYGGPCRQGVLAKISANLGSLVYSTYLHPTRQLTSEAEVRVKAMEVDAAGAVYVLGSASNQSFAPTPGALQQSCGWYSCEFVAKLNPAGSARVYSAVLPFFPAALQLDPRGNVYLAGGGYLNDPGPTTPNAQQARPADARLFVTADGGATWRPKPPPQDTSSVALGHGIAPVLYTGSYARGLFRSTDLGNQWDLIDNQFFGGPIVAPTNPNILYEPNYRLLRRSSDGGSTWAFVPTPIEMRALTVDPVDAQTLFIGGLGGGLFKSVNGGYTWSSASTGIVSSVTVDSIVVAPSNHNVLYARVSRFNPTEWTALYRSLDGGASWTLLSPLTTSFGGPMAVDPLDAARVYVCSFGRIMRSTDSGATWTLFAESWCSAIAVTRTPEPAVFVASQDGLARVVDPGGTVPTPLSVSLGNSGVYQLAVDPVDPRIMAAVTFSTGDAFLAVLDPTGASLRYASYFGGADSDSINGIALAANGMLALTGNTKSPDLPLVNPRVSDLRVSTVFDSFVALMRIPLPTIVMDAPAAGTVGPVFNVSGWAIDSGAAGGAGIDAVHVWAFPRSGGAPSFVGVAAYGAARPDIGSVYGAQFTNSGFSLAGARLTPGSYTVAAYAHSSVSGSFDAAASRAIDVVSGARMSLDAPVAGAALYQPFTIAGWALDTAAPSGTGVDAVHVWAYPAVGAPRFVGVATYGVDRPDVAAVFGSRFAATGFTLQASGLPPGPCTLAVFAHSSVSGAFDLVRTVTVTLPDGGAAAIDTPATGGAVSTPFVVSGWAIDRQGAGTGVDAVHVWAIPATGTAPVFLGVPTVVARPDVAAAFGDSRFEPSGYSLTVNTLPPGTYTVAVYARSVVTGAFSIVRSVQVIVP
jgi:photosystem II stability/assembly factor-like uncharacterized protein